MSNGPPSLPVLISTALLVCLNCRFLFPCLTLLTCNPTASRLMSPVVSRSTVTFPLKESPVKSISKKRSYCRTSWTGCPVSEVTCIIGPGSRECRLLLKRNGATRTGETSMLVRVYVTPNAKQARVFRVSEDYFEVWVDERAVGGRANKRLLELLAEHFK